MDQPMMMGWMTDNWLAFTGGGILILVLLVTYYVLLVRAVLDMLRRKANTALLVFGDVGADTLATVDYPRGPHDHYLESA